MRMSSQKLGWAIAGLAAALLAGTSAEAVTRGGKMIYGRYADSLFLDPVLNDANVDIWVLTNLYDTLLAPSADGQGLQPGLATKWDLSDEGKSVVISLRPDVKFADGTPMTSEDVKWSLDRARDPKAGAWNSSLASIDAVEAKDPATVVLRLKNPDPTILPALATFNSAILPKKLFEAAPGATPGDKAKAFAEKPVGTGPFMLTDWKRGVSMKLARNPYYWKQGEDGKALPYLDELEFQIIPDDATRLLKLKAGEIDGTEFVPYARVQELKSDPSLRMELWPSTRVAYLTMNVRPTLKDGKPNPLTNPKVRQAINLAVNKNAVIQITTQGLGKPMQSFMSSTTPLYYGPAPLYTYDLAKAKSLMSEAGFGSGFDMSCLALSGNGDDSTNLTAVQQMLGQIGVKLRIDQVDNATRTARYREGDFQCRTAAWTNDISDPSQITSYFAYFPNIESLHSGYQDKRIDELFVKSQQENNPDTRRAQYKEIQEIYNGAAPIIYLYETPYPVAFRTKAKGFVQIPLGNNLFEAAYVDK
ncbi:MAG: ABC transporter substrate-binding protein [Microvirga sp.]